MRRGRHARRLALLILGAAAWSCARQGAPPGGPEDRLPPLVVSVEPDTFAIVEPGLDRLRVRFNERVSEQGAGGPLNSVVEISPEVPDLRVEHDRQGLDIHIPGGLRPGLTYRVRVTPDVRDMFGNPMAVPFEWVFSTGGEFTENAVVGQVWDRATGAFLDGVRVVLDPGASESDSLVYASRSGEEGLFALRSVPAGSFNVLAFRDQNGDREPGGSEALGRGQVDALGATDTVFLSLSLLVPDTTAAVLVRAEASDSVTVNLSFDDFVDPTVSLEATTVGLSPLPADSAGVLRPQPEGPLPNPARVFHAAEWEVYQDSIRTVADSLALLASDSIAEAEGAEVDASADSAGGAPPSVESVAPDIAAPGPPARLGQAPPPPTRGSPGGQEPRVLPDGTPIPQPSIVVLFDGPLPPNVEIAVVVSGVINLNGLDEGGGAVNFTWAPPAPDTIPTDSLASDSTGLVPDTLQLVPDTLQPVPDPAAVPPDPAGWPRRD